MVKIHARVTKEIEITEEQAERIANYLCKSSENNDIDDILDEFVQNVYCGYYEAGYIPAEWLWEDLMRWLDDGELKNYLEANCTGLDDIDL